MFEFKAAIDIEKVANTPSSVTISGHTVDDVLRQAKFLAVELKDIFCAKCTVTMMISNVLFIKNSEPEITKPASDSQ
jgi:hypothetical protein